MKVSFTPGKQKITAIKVYRMLTGSGLREAKEAIDEHYSILGGNAEIAIEISSANLISKYPERFRHELYQLDGRVEDLTSDDIVYVLKANASEAAHWRKYGVFTPLEKFRKTG